MREQDEDVDEDFVSWSFNFKILKKNVDAKHFKCLVNDILSVDCLKGLISWTVKLGLKRD
jgi:hypothetical protein